MGVACACIPLFLKRDSRDHRYLPDRVNRGYKPLPQSNPNRGKKVNGVSVVSCVGAARYGLFNQEDTPVKRIRRFKRANEILKARNLTCLFFVFSPFRAFVINIFGGAVI